MTHERASVYLPYLVLRGPGWTIEGRLSYEDAEEIAKPRRAEGQTVTIEEHTEEMKCH